MFNSYSVFEKITGNFLFRAVLKFNVQNYELQDYLDDYCINVRKIIRKNASPLKLEIAAPEEVIIQPTDDLNSKIKIFFEKYIKDNFEILLEDFVQATGKKSNDEAIKY